MMAKIYMITFLFVYFLTLCMCTENSFTSKFLTYASFGLLKCTYEECCDEPWINWQTTGLTEKLEHQFYGQHLAKTAVLNSLAGFLKNPNPQKALVMSFNGLTGSGKSFLSRTIATHLYKKGLESKYVHLYIANKDFPHAQKVALYQDRLREEIQLFTKECGRSLFILEEVEKMPPGTIDIIKPYIDYHGSINEIDYTRNIFIFLSNSGSQGITDHALEFWANGKEREDMNMKDIEALVTKGAFNEKGGFQYSELLSSSLIDVFIPFLPMEKKHVQMCIKAELKRMNLTKSSQFVKEVAESMQYFPIEELFSVSGCKRIENKINLLLLDN